MFRKIFAILLTFFVIGSVPGFTLFVHYCHGAASDISLWDDSQSCKMNTEIQKTEANKSCCKKEIVKSCCESSSQHKHSQNCVISQSDCCQTQIVKAHNVDMLSFRPDSKIQQVSVEYVINLPLLISSTVCKENTSNHNILSLINPLTLSGRNICIKDCHYLI